MKDVIIVRKNELPLVCPRKNYLNPYHPRIFLPIEKQTNKIITCSYCSTVYKLKEDD